MKFRKIIDELAADFDLSMKMGRKEAYNRCYEYARENLSQSAECNLFLAEAADLFDQTRIHMELIESMAAPSGAERFYVVFAGDNECELIGNRPGLAYMSRVFRALSETPMGGEHIHFRQDDPVMQGDTRALTVYYEPDDWFDRYTQDYEPDEKDDASWIVEKKIAAGAVIALCVTEDFPPNFCMSKDKIYRVVEHEEFDGQEGISAKRIRKSIGRMYTFSLVDDVGEDVKFAFDLDDWTVVFFTSGDLEQLRQ